MCDREKCPLNGFDEKDLEALKDLIGILKNGKYPSIPEYPPYHPPGRSPWLDPVWAMHSSDKTTEINK